MAYKWEDNPIYLDKSAVFIQRIFHTLLRDFEMLKATINM